MSEEKITEDYKCGYLACIRDIIHDVEVHMSDDMRLNKKEITYRLVDLQCIRETEFDEIDDEEEDTMSDVDNYIKILNTINEPLIIDIDVNDKIMVSYKDFWVKDDCVMRGVCGRGDTLEQSIIDYIHQINNKTICQNVDDKTDKLYSIHIVYHNGKPVAINSCKEIKKYDR